MKRKPVPPRPDTGATTAVMVRRPARIVTYEPGSAWRLGSHRVTLVAQLTSDRLLVRHAADDKTETAAVSALSPWIPGTDAAPRTVPVPEHPDRIWLRALEEHRLISALVETGMMGQVARAPVARALRLSDRQLRRKIRRFQDLASPAAFLPQRRGPLPGSTYLHPEVEQLVGEEIRRALKVSPDIAADDLYPLLRSAAQALKHKPPGRNTVHARLRQARRCPQNLPAPIGGKLAYREAPVHGSPLSAGPLDVVEMDHTVCDVHILDSQYGYPIGRPVLSIMIDRKTRVILGLLVSLEKPSRLSVGLCLHHGVFPKAEWLAELGIPDACFPGFGLPSTLYTDNAKEFTSIALKRAAQVWNVTLGLRPLGDPAAGGIIERAIGTLMTKARLLPGTSYSKLLGEAPRHPAKTACFTMGEFTLYLARQVSIYHKQRHEGLGMPPLMAWERGWVINGTPALPPIPECADAFRLTFLPGEWRVITREGVELFSLHYQSEGLYPLIRPGRRIMVRYDPRDLSQVFVETADEHIKVPLRGTPMPAFSLWEWQEVHARRREAGRPRDPETIAQELRANRDLIEQRSHQKGRWHEARRVARESEWKRSRLLSVGTERILKFAPLDTVPPCRVKE
ncbi:MAG TPA: Mu transposase C-terminal domain-containing protein [Steroidobacteraceae bacterium]|nr:Mu transposase C-terminal domain-containing protein [Steroidobacteraceae bacterium]